MMRWARDAPATTTRKDHWDQSALAFVGRGAGCDLFVFSAEEESSLHSLI
jgi:hypothetical protein